MFILENEYCLLDDKTVWEAAARGGIEFKIRFQQNYFLPFMYETIYYKPKRLIFKESDLKIQLTVQENLKIRTIKKILVLQMKKNNF
jgi:hypothetical protein